MHLLSFGRQRNFPIGRIPTYNIEVSESDADRALHVLVNNQLPKDRSQGFSEVYPAGEGGLIPSKSEEKARFLMAIQGEIERKLKTFPAVVKTHVSVVIPDKDIIRDVETAPPAARASVAVVYNPTPDGQSPITSDDVKDLVASSVEELKKENVTVVMTENQPFTILENEGNGTSAIGPLKHVLGIQVVGQKSASRTRIVLGIFGLLGIAGLGLGAYGVYRSVSLKSELHKRESEVEALERAQQE